MTTGFVAGSPRDDAVQNLIDPSLKRFRESDGRPVLQFFIKEVPCICLYPAIESSLAVGH